MTKRKATPGPIVRGKHGGLGKKLSYAEIKREAARVLDLSDQLQGWRCPQGTPEAARRVADLALAQIQSIAEGGQSFRIAPAMLKAAITLREEICGAIEARSRISGELSLEALVCAAALKARDPMQADAAVNAPIALPASEDPEV